MAEFCMRCSLELFGEDYGDFARLTTKRQYAHGRAAVVLCEGCGCIQVDPKGRCITKDCLKSNNKFHTIGGDE